MSDHQFVRQFAARSLAAAVAMCLVAPAIVAAGTAPAVAPARWIDQIDVEDRAPLEAWLGYLPPRLDASLRWVGADIVSDEQSASDPWRPYLGKIVIVQSWSVANEASRERLAEVTKVAEQFSDIDVQLVALHTPEAADGAEAYIRENGLAKSHVVAIDAEGEFCDALGIYKTPVNLVIGRNGAIRYAGLTPSGLGEAIDALLDEDPAEAPCAGSRSLSEASDSEGSSASFPPHTGNIRANDLRGKRAPDFYVQEWVNADGTPRIGHNVTVIKFWRTSCPHCLNAIPHTNSLAKEFGDRVTVVSITHENRSALEQGLSRRQLSVNSFEHPVAIDGSSRMRQVVQPLGVPNAMVIGSDWIVRWQGHPAHLTSAVLGQIIRADEAQRFTHVKRWQAEREGEG